MRRSVCVWERENETNRQIGKETEKWKEMREREDRKSGEEG